MTEEKDQTEERPEDNPYWDVHPLSYWRYPAWDLPDMFRASRDRLKREWREAISEAKGEEDSR
ncbi:MAG: hypothetical protein ISN26_05955 [Betaproteobacteria bacterium AqS2]|uniref:Uncharacterized protein n=1 Tax=Candidatus Amphirhobacter heronislandensis TaxID=1732024 RepID=A0A930UH61_9GAMM|nr:hypothetical protein [Betaproteobacteria bacterium AqS2]